MCSSSVLAPGWLIPSTRIIHSFTGLNLRRDFAVFGDIMSATPWACGPTSGVTEYRISTPPPTLFLPEPVQRHSLITSMFYQ